MWYVRTILHDCFNMGIINAVWLNAVTLNTSLFYTVPLGAFTILQSCIVQSRISLRNAGTSKNS